VLRPITTNCLTAVGAWARCGWIPSSPTFTPDVWKMLKFGGHLTGFTLTDFAGRSGDRVAIGYRVGPAGLGYYQNALLVYDNILDVLVGPLHNVATASLSKLGNNPSELHRLWAKALSTLAFFAMPVFGLLAVLGQDLIVVVLGAKWQASAVLLSVIALRGIPQVVERTLGWLHVAAGRTDRWMRWGLFALGVQMTALLAGLPFGPIGVAWAQVLSMFILFVPAIAYAGRPLGIGVLDVIAIVGRPLGGTLACVILGFTLRYTVLADTGAFLRMFVLSATYAVSYLIIVVGILDMRSPFTLGLSLARDVLPARLQRWVPQFSSAL
jgi:PST family polysaccharide transporter